MLKVICDEHNHPPAQHLEGHPFARRLSADETRLVADLTRKNVTPRNILSTLKDQNKNNVSVIKTVYNAQQKIRMDAQAGKTPMQVLMSHLHTNNYVYDFTTGDSNELENLFFIHPTSWNICRAFPHVVIIDATYKTNAYNKAFVEIVGMTSTQKTFSIGFVFMHNEQEPNYTWALNCLKSTLDECMQPRVIITDRELALINACRTLSLQPRATDIEEPVVQKNTRGRPSLKKQQKKKANRPRGIPSGFNNLDLNQEPERHSYSFDLLEELHSGYSLYHGAFTSGFNELHESLCWNTSPAYEPHYMIMPLTGYLIASKFRVIVHCLSHEQSMTCFPLSKGPEECQPHRTITLVNVNGNHYMSVFLKENYPMPPTTPYWNAHRNSSASAWKAMYRSRFELYNQLTSRSFVPHWINIDD
ncbi:hypothetical protein LXL04_021403 [Taraxacum kok-saghyz]